MLGWWVAALAQQAGLAVAHQKVSLAIVPERGCLDPRTGEANVDLLIRNAGGKDAAIGEVRAFALDRRGAILERRLLWQQALPAVVPDATIKAADTLTLFSPFRFTSGAAIARIRYEIDVAGAPMLARTVAVGSCAPAHAPKSPLVGRLLVYDGHDLWSHHRRGTYADEWSEAMGIADNFQRFGVDLVLADANASPHRGAGAAARDWYGFDAPVRAGLAGIVADVRSDQPDNSFGTLDRWTEKVSRERPMASYGNYVLVDHGGGEFSLFAHLRLGSVAVRAGQRVGAATTVGRIGMSGASPVPHLHFERRTGNGLAGIRTLPPHFSGVRLAGSQRRTTVAVNTGDLFDAD